jgi:hypothetical protein
VQINDLERSDVPVLARAQLWSGLLARAERPELFDGTIESTRPLGRDGGVLDRDVTRGSLTTRETVRLSAGESIQIGICAGTEFAGSVLTIAIEEPAPRALFLRFTYDVRGGDGAFDAAEQHAIRQAYYFANLETVRRIRALAAVVA